MKKFYSIIIWLALSICVVACGVEKPEDTTAQTTVTTSVDETTTLATTLPKTVPQTSTCQIGNIVFSGPVDMEVEAISDDVSQITLKTSKAYVTAFCNDVSSLDEDMLGVLLYAQHKAWTEDRGEANNISDISEMIAGFEATGEYYTSTNDNGVKVYFMDLTFSDTWNAYTIQFCCNGQDENWVDYLQLFADFLDSAEYVGQAPRFADDLSGSDTQADAEDLYSPAQNEPEQTSPPPQDKPEETDPPKKDQPEETTPPTQSGPSAGEANALSSAKDYLRIMPFSYNGLIDQLEYDGYTHSEATYAADNCGADWNEQAVIAATDYIDLMPFSYTGLVEQLEYNQYTRAQAEYGANHCGADWYEQAAKAAENYLNIMSFSREGLIEQLEYDGFTHEQAVYGVEQNGL